MNTDEIYKRVLGYNLKLSHVKNGKLTATNFRFALRDGVITEEEYDYYFSVSFFREILGENKEKTIEVLVKNSSFRLNGYKNRSVFASKSDIDYYLEHGFRNVPNCEKILAQILDKLENYYVDLCKELEKNGYEELEYVDSDEYITETIKANNYEFLSDGKRY